MDMQSDRKFQKSGVVIPVVFRLSLNPLKALLRGPVGHAQALGCPGRTSAVVKIRAQSGDGLVADRPVIAE
jgi:hypothetical protein